MRIEMPFFAKLREQYPSSVFDIEIFHKWWVEQIEPINALLEKSEVVCKAKDGGWYDVTDGSHTHKALLIDIQPIEKESAEDILRDILEHQGAWSYAKDEPMHDLLKRAKAVFSDS